MDFLKKLDHPLMFLFFLALAMTGLQSVMAWLFLELGAPGAAALVRH